MSMPFLKAEAYAEKIGESLMPFCSDIQICGSIRRKKPEVGDIDLVVMLRSPADHRNLMLRCRESCSPVAEGPINLRYTTKLGIQLDVYIATPRNEDMFRITASNWGSLVLCRTGSVAHNVRMVEAAKSRGMVWKPYVGLLDAAGMVIASETEEEIFRAMGMPYTDPAKREAL